MMSNELLYHGRVESLKFVCPDQTTGCSLSIDMFSEEEVAEEQVHFQNVVQTFRQYARYSVKRQQVAKDAKLTINCSFLRTTDAARTSARCPSPIVLC